MGLYLYVEADTASGRPVDPDTVDEIGNRLTGMSASINFHLNRPRVTVAVYVDLDDLADAVRHGVDTIAGEFEQAGEPLIVRSVHAHTPGDRGVCPGS